jgi:hypothetical protein
MEEMDYNILFRWFVGLNLDDPVWDATVFTKNRNRLLEGEVAKEFLVRVVEQARGKGWTSDEHFTVDGTLLAAWASVKSFQPKDKKSSPPPDDPGNPTVNFHRESARIRRTNRKAIPTWWAGVLEPVVVVDPLQFTLPTPPLQFTFELDCA